MAVYAFRPFGSHKGDLDIDFDSPRPRLVSDVLCACLVQKALMPLDQAALEALPVGGRLAMLIELVQVSGLEILTAKLACDAPACGQSSELDIDLPALLDMHRQTNQAEKVEVNAEGASIHLRRPTAEDQYQWRQSDFASPQLAAEQMMLSLVVESEVDLASPIPETIVQAIEEAMRMADPLMAPTIKSECPDCGQWQEKPLDLGKILLRQLEEIQTGMIEAIHLMAKSYHWTEDRILALSAKRRGKYLKLINREG